MKSRVLQLSLLSICFVAAINRVTPEAFADDWPQYLGPNRNSTSSETGISRKWPESGPQVLWRLPVGRGFGGPAIRDGKVFLLDRDDNVGETLRCINLEDGQELWTYAYEAPGSVMFPGSRSVPTVDREHVYICGHNGDLHCVSIQSQKPVWKANVWADFGGQPPSEGGGFRPGPADPGSFPIWAVTQNPLIYDDLLIVASQAPAAGVVAYEKATGKVKWKTPSLGYVGYVSPSVAKISGEDHIVMVSPSTNPFSRGNTSENKLGKVVGIDPKSGKILWEYDKWNCHISVASAVDAGENRLLIVGGYELGATMIQIEKNEQGFTAKELFVTEEFGDQTKPPILYKGHFYAQYGTNNRRDGLVCMNMQGEIMWKTRRDPSFNKGSMILVDGVILATDGERSLYVVDPDPKEFKAIQSAELLGEGGVDNSGIAGRIGGATQNWAPIALSEGKLLIRDQTEMKCVQVGP